MNIHTNATLAERLRYLQFRLEHNDEHQLDRVRHLVAGAVSDYLNHHVFCTDELIRSELHRVFPGKLESIDLYVSDEHLTFHSVKEVPGRIVGKSKRVHYNDAEKLLRYALDQGKI